MTSHGYSFTFHPPTIHQGETALEHLSRELADRGLDRALVVTSPSVAESQAVMEPLREALGSRLAIVVDTVSPAKYLQTAVAVAKAGREADADVIVGLGGGSSLDIAKISSVLLAHGDPIEPVAENMVETTSISLPDAALPPIFAVPTTLPGAEISQVAGVTFSLDPTSNPKGTATGGVVSDPRLLPSVVCYDHRLYRATPERILRRSAMNGFDKGIEMVYSRNHTPITDATAVRGLRLLTDSLPRLAEGERTDGLLSDVLSGIALVQYGVSTPGAYRASIIHAFGHALTYQYPIQQGQAHAIAAPHVLEYLFSAVDGRRDLLAEAFDLGKGSTELTADDVASQVVGAVESVRDSLGLPGRLRSVAEAERSDIPALASAVLDDSFMAAAPEGLEPTQSDIESVFEAMW